MPTSPSNPMSAVIQHLRTTLSLPMERDRTDSQLLEAFLAGRDPMALEALVRRYASMVWNICHRVLRDPQDAEDAFQATFLVLVRKAASIRCRAKVGNWLYGVAHQTALKARATRARRRGRERSVTEMPEPTATPLDLWSDLQPLLDQELSRLPEIYRAALVLCELGGQTLKQAARQLGCPAGTVASRLARGRTMLAKRLARHGLAVTGATLAGVLSEQAVSAGVPMPLLTTTIKTTTLLAAGRVAATTSAAPVAALAREVLQAMFLTKLKSIVGVLLVVAGVGLGGGYLQQMAAAPSSRNAAEMPGNAVAQAQLPSAPRPNEPAPDVDPQDAVDALTAQHVQLERDARGRVVQALLPARSPALGDVIAQLKRLPRLALISCNADNLSLDHFRQVATLPALVQFELHANDPCRPLPWPELRAVRVVRLSGSGIGNDVLKSVADMPAVTSVHLNAIKASAAGYAHLKKLRNLDAVLIQQSGLTADGIKHLRGVGKLRTLTVAGNPIGAAGFAQFSTLTGLEYLNLESTGCTDADIACLLPLANLQHLDLGYNKAISDAGVGQLAGLPRLTGLRLYETRVTAAGVAKLKNGLPNLSVRR